MRQDSLKEVLILMSDGNPGAATVLVQLIKSGDVETIERLLEYDIKGSHIWVLYKDLCDQSLQTMAKLVQKCPKEILIAACSREDRSGREMVNKFLFP
jgi:hypothetical protein